MEEPREILPKGTRVRTHPELGPITGFLIKGHYVSARRPDTTAILHGHVPGHGGDIYWAVHLDGSTAVYGWPEFELETVSHNYIPLKDAGQREKKYARFLWERLEPLDEEKRIVPFQKFVEDSRYDTHCDELCYRTLVRRVVLVDAPERSASP